MDNCLINYVYVLFCFILINYTSFLSKARIDCLSFFGLYSISSFFNEYIKDSATNSIWKGLLSVHNKIIFLWLSEEKKVIPQGSHPVPYLSDTKFRETLVSYEWVSHDGAE